VAPVVVESAFLGWRDVPLVQLVAGATGLPTVISNDVQALTSAEHWFGAGAGLRSMVLLTVGAGVGCGLILNGQLVDGAHGLVGRISHLIVDPGGPVCGLGHRGCAASYLLTDAMVRALSVASGTPVSYADVVERARGGDRAARRLFDDAGHALGVLIGTVANLLDPQKVLLTGDGLPVWEISADQVRRGIAATYEADPELIDLDVQPFDFDEWARAGAALAIQATLTGTASRPAPGSS
jgi:predicted NBD/HSP70 family sugar kinase